MENSNVLYTIVQSYKDIIEHEIADNDNQKQNAERGRSFILRVHEKLEELVGQENNIIIFSKEKKNELFRRNEFLFDIHICEIDYTESQVHKKMIPFVRQSLVEIESEFATDVFCSLEDFHKLVCGKAKLKIMILPLTNNVKNYLEPLKPVAFNIPEDLYIIFLPHPEKWSRIDESNYRIFCFSEGDWKEFNLAK